MNHDCKCECKHKNVKYCKKCNKAHCLDCNKEWPENDYWYHFRWYPPQIYYPYYEPCYPTWTDGTTQITITDDQPETLTSEGIDRIAESVTSAVYQVINN